MNSADGIYKTKHADTLKKMTEAAASVRAQKPREEFLHAFELHLGGGAVAALGLGGVGGDPGVAGDVDAEGLCGGGDGGEGEGEREGQGEVGEWRASHEGCSVREWNVVLEYEG
jgi:hypothetical protein